MNDAFKKTIMLSDFLEDMIALLSNAYGVYDWLCYLVFMEIIMTCCLLFLKDTFVAS